MNEPIRIIRSRNPKINNKQKKILLQFLADHPTIYFHKISTDFTFEDHALFWKRAASVLNLFGPPVKKPEIWKKAWTDTRLRYRKAGIDTKRILLALKTERIVDTEALLENVQKLADANGVQRARLLEKCGVNVSYLDNDGDDIANYMLHSSHRKSNPADFKVDLSKTREVAAELGIASLEDKVQDSEKEFEDELKGDIDHYEELYLKVDDLSKLDEDFTNVSTSNYQNGSITEVLLDEPKFHSASDRDEEKNTTRAETTSEFISSELLDSVNSRTCSSPNRLLHAVLFELRKQNRLQMEKLETQRSFFNQQKSTMQRMLNAQIEMANAQTALANTVKSLMNNISFNS